MAGYLGQPLGLKTAQSVARNPVQGQVPNTNMVPGMMEGIQTGAQTAEWMANRDNRDLATQQVLDAQAEQLRQAQLVNPQIVKQNQQIIDKEADLAKRTSLFNGALNFQEAIKSAPTLDEKIQAGYDVLNTRLAKLKAEGKDTTETEESLRLWDNPETRAQLVQGSKTAIEAGYKQGLGRARVATAGQGLTAKTREYKMWQSLPPGEEKDAYGRATGFVPKPLNSKNSIVATPTGHTVVDSDTGEVIKKITDEEKKAVYEANRDEKKRIKVEKIRDLKRAQDTIINISDEITETLNQIVGHEGFENAVGAKSLFGGYAGGLLDEPIAASAAAGAKALIDQFKAKGFLQSIKGFKDAGGLGSLSNEEGKQLTAAFSALSQDISEADFIKYTNQIITILNKQKMKAKKSSNRLQGQLDAIDPPKKEAGSFDDEDAMYDKKYGG